MIFKACAVVIGQEKFKSKKTGIEYQILLIQQGVDVLKLMADKDLPKVQPYKEYIVEIGYNVTYEKMSCLEIKDKK